MEFIERVDIWSLPLNPLHTHARSPELLRQVWPAYAHGPTPVIRRSRFGQPQLDNLAISVSHCRERALLVLAPRPFANRDFDVGVDLEYVHRDLDFASIVRDHFAPAEQLCFSASPDHLRRDVFFHIWTQKEAVSKALGLGLQMDFRKIEVEPDPHNRARLLRLDSRIPDHRWKLIAAPIDQGFRFGLAVRDRPGSSQNWTINWRELPSTPPKELA